MNRLATKFITSLHNGISGHFVVKGYQRGFRWGSEEVGRLLDDIMRILDSHGNATRNYCIQPIVVKRLGEDVYELVDGQQRLTTLYLVLCDLNRRGGGLIPEPKFDISYETRGRSTEYLKHPTPERKEENIDFWHIFQAAETVRQWFDSRSTAEILGMVKLLEQNVMAIWYEVDEYTDSIALFSRLNIGKIPLTSSELVKALFLGEGQASGDSAEQEERRKFKNEMALQWDSIERQLHSPSLWGFLANENPLEMPTRIDLVLDLISGRNSGERETYYTFFHFDKLVQGGKTNKEIWEDEILRAFMTLRDWHGDHEIYHKVGYLVASRAKSLKELFRMARGKKKSEFKECLDSLIRESIKIDNSANYGSMSYEVGNDKNKIERLLLLFNVESSRRNGASTLWFPFGRFKFGETEKQRWSLEHIHAQQSQGIGKSEKIWVEWIRLHISPIRGLEGDYRDLLRQMDEIVTSGKVSAADYEQIRNKVLELLSAPGVGEFMHSISNLALIEFSTNAALNNSAFAAKRDKIVEMDRRGQYIPFCTKMVFLKYYTKSERNQVLFWGKDDQLSYVAAINETLYDYLDHPVIVSGLNG